MPDQTPPAPGDGELKRNVTLLDLVMLGAGTAIGAALFSVLGPATQVGGTGVLISVIIAALPMIVFALVYSFMASAVPRTAASYEWQREFTSPALAFAIVWMRILGNSVVMIVLGRVLVQYLGQIVPIAQAPMILVFFTVIFAINYLGIAIAARAQTVLMLMLLTLLGIFVASGLPSLKPALFIDAAAGGWFPILAALPLMIQLFLGIETATEVGGEVKNAERTIPIGMGLAMLLTIVVYLTLVLTALSLVGPAVLANSDAPLLAAAERSLGSWAGPLIITAATIALFKSMNAVFLVYARFLYAMAKAGVLPSALARVHPRFGTPHVASIVVFLIISLGAMLPSSLLFLLIAVNIPTMLKYAGSCLAAYNVAAHHPEVHDRARMKLSRTTVKTLSALGVACAVAIGGLGFTSDWRPYLLLSVWLGAGMAYYAYKKRAAAH